MADFNEDGNPDVAVPLGQIFLFTSDGAGNLAAAPSLHAGSQPHTVIAADFNQDGHLDLAASNRGDGTVSTFLGDGTGGYTLSSTVSVLCPTCSDEE